MSLRTALLITLMLTSIIVLTAMVYFLAQPSRLDRPSWFELGSQVTFEQVFTWDEHYETKYMTWELTSLDNNSVNLHLVSNGLSVSQGNVTIVQGQAEWTVDAYTREITSSTDRNYESKKCPFWIETDVRLDSSVETYYGVAHINDNESIDVLGQRRDCWILHYNWPTSSMTRWYDKDTGLCLKIRVTMHQENLTITITETATQTNVDLGS